MCCQIADALQADRSQQRGGHVGRGGCWWSRGTTSRKRQLGLSERHACGGAPPRVPGTPRVELGQACSLVATVVPYCYRAIAARVRVVEKSVARRPQEARLGSRDRRARDAGVEP